MDSKKGILEFEDSDTSSNISTANIKSSNCSSKDYPQFSVLRSDNGGLRMKISAVRKNIPDDSLTDNNNITTNKLESINKSKHKKKRKMSSFSSSCCSLCSAGSDLDDSLDIKIQKNKKKVKLKKKKTKDIKKANSDLQEKEKAFKNKKKESILDLLDNSQAVEKSHQLPLNDALNSGCISSSDNELPNLVNEAIRRVNATDESDTDNNLSTPQQQYTSSLLQDFMAKTQMLGSTSFDKDYSNDSSTITRKTKNPSEIYNFDENSDEKSLTPLTIQNKSINSTTPKRKRGRPKRTNNFISESLSNQLTTNDSFQNISPIPLKIFNTDETSKFSTISSKPDSHTDSLASSNLIIQNNTVQSSTSQKPKLDISELDKQFYANERTLYPPRNRKKLSSSRNMPKQKKQNDSLDPLWKKIDINAKFRRPSLSGYKSDGGSTVCSKVLAAKSGYLSDYGGYYNRNFSGYKSDVSCKSHYSTKTCASRAKSCDYRSSRKMRKVHRKRRNLNLGLSSKYTKSMSNINDQDILQLAGLSLGQSSEESSRESIIKPLSESSKKYGEINRFVRTGEYYSSSKISNEDLISSKNSTTNALSAFPTETLNNKTLNNISNSFNNKINESTSKLARDIILYNDDDKPDLSFYPRYIRSRRSSAVSVRSSCYSGYSRCKKYRKRRTKYFNKSSSGIIDAKLLIEIDNLINSFGLLCHIACDKTSKDKPNKQIKQQEEKNDKTIYSNVPKSNVTKKNMKKRKMSENIDSHHNSSIIIKRRHKKAVSSSPDEHKLPLKKRHYLLASREKIDGKNLHPENYDQTVKEGTSSNLKTLIDSLHPKKQQITDQSSTKVKDDLTGKSQEQGKHFLKSVENKTDIISNKSFHPKSSSIETPDSNVHFNSRRKSKNIAEKSLENKSKEKQVEISKISNFPPPGIFEPSIDLEIQIPSSRITTNIVLEKSSESSSPLPLSKSLYESPINLTHHHASSRKNRECVVEKLLNKTGASLLLKRRKKKKINRTGFPTVRKRKILTRTSPNDEVDIELLDFVPDPHKKLEEDKHKEKSKKTNESLMNQIKLKDNKTKVTENQDNSIGKERNIQRKKRKQKIMHEKTEQKQEKSKIKIKEEKLLKKIDAIKSCNVKKPRGRPRLLNTKSMIKKELTRETQNMIKTTKLTKQKSNAKVRKIDDKAAKDVKQKALKATVGKAIQSLKMKEKMARKNKSGKETPLDVHVDLNENLNEHEPLPIKMNQDQSETESIAEIEIQSNNNNISIRKGKILKKTYLVAGLFSDYFKVTKQRKNSTMGKSTESSTLNGISNNDNEQSEVLEPETNSLLPPPPYCEKFFRRTLQNFYLPHDIWLEYKHSKLSKRVNVPSWNYRKIRTNIYAADVVRPLNTDHQSCNCKIEQGCGDDCLNRMVYTECYPSTCPCKDKCRNQKIQKHDIAPGIERFMTENKGWGVRTNLPIRKGTYILEYVGEVVTEKEFKERMATLYINDSHHYCLHLDGGLVIDGHRMGSDGRFVNHSCSPNCEMQKWSVNGLPRMALFASRNIQAGEELTYDYNFSLFNPSEGQPCRCETPQCRGVIGGKSQRIKIEPKSTDMQPPPPKAINRKRKRKAVKNIVDLINKDLTFHNFQPLTDKEKKIIKSFRIFMLRNLEKTRKSKEKISAIQQQEISVPVISRPLTPSSLVTQISALKTQRNIKTRGLTQASHDPEIEKMAKIAVILKEICETLETLKDVDGKPFIIKIFANSRRKKLSPSKKNAQDFNAIKKNIEKGVYKSENIFDKDINLLFECAQKANINQSDILEAIKSLKDLFNKKRTEVQEKFNEINKKDNQPREKSVNELGNTNQDTAVNTQQSSENQKTEDIIRCICGLFKDEGLMIQCSQCLVWQHAECTKADVLKENYLCERCEPRIPNLEIPMEDFTEEGYRYYLSLLRGNLQIRQGDTVYVLRDIPIENSENYGSTSTLSSNKQLAKTIDSKNINKKHTYETIGNIDFTECDIFRVERLWKDHDGKRFIFGHHYLRPHETFHEPSRKFYPNEVVRVPLYEVVPIELVMDRCWVLDRNTFCKGRPIDCTDEKHVYICELRVDKSARLFAKAKQNYITCTKNYAFKYFKEKLKVVRNYAPHDLKEISVLKAKKKKNELTETCETPPIKKKCVRHIRKKKLSLKTITQRRTRLENVLLKLKFKQNINANDVVDVSYLLTGRSIRQRKTLTSASAAAKAIL